jgi:hypothetical protein
VAVISSIVVVALCRRSDSILLVEERAAFQLRRW